ncbi:MAG: glycosyltransferase family 2 protein [Candidatus Kerfeldbacteria bacterium]|nr:glycosyltransferase family 2 protein [Candidatus Kerfeldbacteria bacterium]
MNNKVSLVTLNFNGKKFLEPLLHSLREQTYSPVEIIVVDNHSTDGSRELLQSRYPDVKLVENGTNLGFAGGNNSALPHCTGEYVGLINNDVVADPHYVEFLVAALEQQNADVVGSKILFYTPFITLRFETPTFIPSENNQSSDTRKLGCMVGSICVDSVDYPKRLFLDQTYGEEQAGEMTYHWISNNAIVKVPVATQHESATLRIQLASSDAMNSPRVHIFIGENEVFAAEISTTFREYEIPLSRELIHDNGHFVINNASSRLDKHTGSGGDVGMNEDDLGQYDTPHEVETLCGGSMMIRKSIIDQYGLFDEYFFAYYEDTDFCWRLNRLNKKLFYEPRAVMYHYHTGTSKEWSPLFRFLTSRNRLAMMLKHASIGDVARQWGEEYYRALHSLVYRAYRLLKKRVLHGPEDANATIRFRVCLDLVMHFPSLVWKRLRFPHHQAP